MFKWPKTREDFWRNKIRKNQERDIRVVQALMASEWRVLTVWECTLRGSTRMEIDDLIDLCETFLLEKAECQAEIG